MSNAPETHILDAALSEAAKSPCRSKRGVVAYDKQTVVGIGHNGPPVGLICPGRDLCRGTCGKRSVHAEVRALRSIAAGYRVRSLDLVHVELASDGGVVACGGPSCWQCSREIIDCGFIGGVWLYEDDVLLPGDPPIRGCAWVRYTAEEFHRVTLQNCGMTP